MSSASGIRFEDDGRNPSLDEMLDEALSLYGVLIRDNIDLARLPAAEARARVVGRALIERGDARAFVLGRRLLAAAPR